MIRPFSVEIEDDPGKGHQVIAIDKGKLLVAANDGHLRWVAVEVCKVAAIFFDRDETTKAPWLAEIEKDQ